MIDYEKLNRYKWCMAVTLFLMQNSSNLLETIYNCDFGPFHIIHCLSIFKTTAAARSKDRSLSHNVKVIHVWFKWFY